MCSSDLKADLLTSTSGPTGGYRLSRPPETISIGFIIDTIEGRPAIVQCLRDDHISCEQHDKCTIRTPPMRVNERVLYLLNHISLAEICQEEPPTSSPISFLIRA